MAFDGMVMAALTSELRTSLVGGRISKIAMPEKDELLITIINYTNSYRLLISAGASLPLIYLTDEKKPSPITAPAFCMLLRKHIGTARIVNISQYGLERIIEIELEHLDDLGDIAHKKLIIEMMGKYSNIIFTKDDGTIIDSIKRVPASVSSIREVLPGKQYVFPDELKKRDPLIETEDNFVDLLNKEENVLRTIYMNYAGLSPLMAQEICFRAKVDSDINSAMLDANQKHKVYISFSDFINLIKNEKFSPVMISRNEEPVEFSAFYLDMYDADEYEEEEYSSISCLLQVYYSSKDSRTRIRQKSADLRKISTNALERASKKYELQEKQLKDCGEKEKYKVYGDLLNTYGYSLQGGEKSFTCFNFYDGNKEITIPLDEHKTSTENAKKYFDKYSKYRRTEEALKEEIKKTSADVDHLTSILQSLDLSTEESDLAQIRSELVEFGYLKKHSSFKSKTQKSEPLHFVSTDGYDIYVGKNNYQNEEISFNLASNNDWWFHAKGVPGSHVIVKMHEGQNPDSLPDNVFVEAAGLAAYYSKNGQNDKVEVDYTQKKNLKRVHGAPPGFVIYHTNYSMIATPKGKI